MFIDYDKALKFRIFIACSASFVTLAVKIKEAIETHYKYLDVDIWSEDHFFKSPHTTVETLNAKIISFDGALFFLTPDDIRVKNAANADTLSIGANVKNGGYTFIPRDNVLVEFGMFFGRIGRNHAIPIVFDDQKHLVTLPTDALGVTYVHADYYWQKCKPRMSKKNIADLLNELSDFLSKTCQPISTYERISDAMKTLNKYIFRTAMLDDLSQIAQIAEYAYGETPVNSFGKKEEWFNKNPNCFWVVKDSLSGINKANVSILPITEECYKKFRRGDILESEIAACDIHSPEEKEQVKNLYVEGLCDKYPEIRPDSSEVLFKDIVKASANMWALHYCLTQVPQIIESLCNPENVENVCAIGGSYAGEKLMLNLGFIPVTKSEDRKDKCDFFNISCRQLISNIEKLIHS